MRGRGMSVWTPWEAEGLPCRVIALTQHGEVHGYLLSTGEDRARVVWGTPSGRVRHCLVHPSELLGPSDDRPWEGVEIPGLRH